MLGTVLGAGHSVCSRGYVSQDLFISAKKNRRMKDSMWFSLSKFTTWQGQSSQSHSLFNLCLHLVISLFARSFQLLRENYQYVRSNFIEEKKKLQTWEQKETTPGSVGGSSCVDICPAGVTASLRVAVFKLCLIFKSFVTSSHWADQDGSVRGSHTLLQIYHES